VITQKDVNRAVTVYLDSGEVEPWLRVLEAIRDGHVMVEARANTLTLTAITRPLVVAFGQRLADLRSESGITHQELFDQMGISISSIIRQLRGQVLGTWPTVSMMITAMGGDPADYRADWRAARSERTLPQEQS
jgi:hypothetical protein